MLVMEVPGLTARLIGVHQNERRNCRLSLIRNQYRVFQKYNNEVTWNES